MITYLNNIGGGQFNVEVPDCDIFIIWQQDVHTASMLNDFQTDNAKLQYFGDLLKQNPMTAYYIYNNLPIPSGLL